MRKFNVIAEDFNKKEFVSYDVIPYLVEAYKKTNPRNRPKTFEEFKKFVEVESRFQWWSRCEYEIVLKSWPNENHSKKIDIFDQIKMNIDLISELIMEELTNEK